MYKFSIIIANYNDNYYVDELLRSLIDTDLVGCEYKCEIIIVNDGCDENYIIPHKYEEYDTPYDYSHLDIKLLERNINLGVGDSFDWGVSIATGEYIILMGADVCVNKNGWVKEAIDDYERFFTFGDKGIMCFANQPLAEDKKHLIRYGASIVWKMDGTSLSEKHRNYGDLTYRDIIQGQWIKDCPKDGIGHVPCLMGAVYLTRRDYYNYIKGFAGHRVWGGLEPLISLKAYLSGGSVVVNSNILTTHSFMRSNRTPDLHHYYANKIFIAQSLFKPEQTRDLLKYYCNIAIRKNILQLSYSYLYQQRDLINYLGDILCYDVRDIEILNYDT